MMNEIVGHLDFQKAYLDDVVIFSRSLSEHVEHIRQAVLFILTNGLDVKKSKFEFSKRKIALFGHMVEKHAIQVNPSTVEVIRTTSRPASPAELRSFLDIADYYGRLIISFASISAPLHVMTSAKVKFQWTEEMSAGFELLKHRLKSLPVLAFPSFDTAFVVVTDAFYRILYHTPK